MASQSEAGGYESPPVEEIQQWGIENDDDNADVWTGGGDT